jgi:hypothetical protein
MDEGLLREISSDYLLPFFSGATLEERSYRSTVNHQLVGFKNHLSIYFKVNRQDKYRLVLTRPQSFITRASRVIPERHVVEAFVSVVGEMEGVLSTNLKQDLLSTFQRRVVARALYNGLYEDTILSGIDQMARWSNRLYEGSPISASLGFRTTSQRRPLTLNSFADEDLSAVLSNGFDTLLDFNFFGEFLRHQSLEKGDALPSFCPMRQAYIADWTTKKHTRLAISLNRLGEILLFRQEELLFARRSGRWHFLTHSPVIAQMNMPRDIDLRTCIYETCLDASFSRTGACFGVVNYAQPDKWRSIVQAKDHLDRSTTNKVGAINTVIGGRNFKDLDRRTRQELAAIDGAIVLSHTGVILAVGAILQIPGGSSGGGRLAAARALAGLGLGIKVSQDGGITGFRGKAERPVFRIMS